MPDSNKLLKIKDQQRFNEKPEVVQPNRIQNLENDEYFKQWMQEHFPDGYVVREYEKDYYHVLVEYRRFKSAGTAVPVKLSRPKLNQFNKAMFKQLENTGAFDGAVTLIIHNPELKEDAKKEGQLQAKKEVEEVEEHDSEKSSESVLQIIAGLEGLNRAELIEYLAESGVDYDSRANKATLLETAKVAILETEFEKKFGEKAAEGMSSDELKQELGL